MLDDAGDIENVAVGHDEGGVLARLDGAERAVDAQDLGGLEGDAAQGGVVVEPVGDGDAHGLGEVAFVGEATGHGERPLHAGGLELGGEGVRLVVGAVVALGEVVGPADDDGGVGGGEQVGAQVRIAPADDDGPEPVVGCPVHARGDLVVVVGVDEHLVLVLGAGQDRRDGLKAQVTHAVLLDIALGVGEDLGEGGDALIAPLALASGVLALETHAGPVDDNAGVALDGEILGGPAVCFEDGRPPGDGAAGGEDAEGEDAVGAGGGDDGGVWVDGHIRADLGGHVAGLVLVERGAHGRDLFEPEDGDAVDEPRVEVLAGEVDDLGVRAERDARQDLVGLADDADDAVGKGDEPVLDGLARDGVNGRADEEDRVILRGGAAFEVLRHRAAGGDGEGCDECCGVFHDNSHVNGDLISSWC